MTISRLDLDLTPELIFKKIYALAKEKNLEALTEMKQLGYCLDCSYNEYLSPAMLLAEEGDVASVNFLLIHFMVNLDYIGVGYASAGNLNALAELLPFSLDNNFLIHGYARGGFDENVEKLIESNADLSRDALIGYAVAGNFTKAYEYSPDNDFQYILDIFVVRGFHEEANKLMLADPNLTPFYGYAVCGDLKKVKQLIHPSLDLVKTLELAALNGQGHVVAYLFDYIAQLEEDNEFSVFDSSKIAIQAFAEGGHAIEVQKILNRAPNTEEKTRLLELALEGYARAGIYSMVEYCMKMGVRVTQFDLPFELTNELQLLRFLVCFEDEKICQKLDAHLTLQSEASLNHIFLKASEIRHMIKHFSITYMAANRLYAALTQVNIKVWLLQGYQFEFPPELILYISSFLLDVPERIIISLHNAMNSKLYVDTTKNIGIKYAHGLFSHHKLFATINRVTNNFEERKPQIL